jgi:hypothetical protein
VMSPSIKLQPGSSLQYFNFTRIANAGLLDQFSFWFISTRGNTISAFPNTNQLNGIPAVGTFPGVADMNSTYQTNQNNPLRLSLNTTKPNQLIYVVVSFDDGNTLDLSGVTSNPILPWALRGTSLPTDRNSGDSILKTFYAIKPSAGPITINVQSSADELNDYYCSAMAFAISDVNTTSPFDGSAQTTIGRNAMPYDTINTHFTNDFIIGAIGIDDLNPVITPGAGFGQIMPVQSSFGASGEPNSMPRSVWSEWSIMADPRNNLPVNCTFPATEDWAIIIDAVKLVVVPPTAPLSLSPNIGPIGQQVVVSGQGFAANSQLIATFDSSQVPFSFTTDATGKIPQNAIFTVPQGATSGIKVVNIIDNKFNYATANFTVTIPSINVSPQIGPVGTIVTITGLNFIDSSSVTIKFNGNSIVTNPSTVTADPTGIFTATFGVSGTAGTCQVTANDTINSASANFAIIPSISITPVTGLNDVPVTISGNGFAANSNLVVTLNGITVSSSPSSPLTDSNGIFSNLVITAQSTFPGQKNISVTDASSNSANATFRLIFNPTVPIPTLSTSSLIFGNSLTGSVTVSGVGGIAPTGTVMFQFSTDSGTTWAALGVNKTLTSGSAISDAYTPLAAGNNYQIRVIYNGDINYTSATSLAATLTVTPTNPTVSVPAFAPLSPINLGTSMTSRVTVTGVLGVTPTGTVTFQVSTDNGGTWNTLGAVKALTGGIATSDAYIPQAAGSNCQFRGIYNSDSNYNIATGNAATLTVSKGTASVSASTFAPASPITLGSSVIVSVSVLAPSGVTNPPTGNVQFMVKVGAGSFANYGSPVALSSGSASISYTPSAIGTYSFQAVYQGDNDYVSGTTGAVSLTLTVYVPSSTSTTLSASSPMILGQSTTDSATVTPQTYLYNQVAFIAADSGYGFTSTSAQSIAYPAGWQANDLLLLQVTVRDTTNTPATPSGFTLLYGGTDSSTIGRQWIYYRFALSSDSSSASLTIAGTACKIARMYDFRNVAPSSFTESPSFGFSAGSTTISAQPITTVGANRLAVSFVFETDNNALTAFSGETGGTWAEALTEFTTTAGSHGGVQLQTATMTSPGTITGGSFNMAGSDSWGVRAFALIPTAALPTGNVNFQVMAPGGSWATYSTQQLASGTATSSSYSPNIVGTWYFRAVYGGDSNYVGSLSGDSDEPLVVGMGTAVVDVATFAPASPIGLGAGETVSVGVSGPNGFPAPTGNVQFQISINSGSYANTGSAVALSGGIASITYNPPAIGTYNFRAVYQGDSNYVSGTTGAPSTTLTVKTNPNVPAPTLNPSVSTIVGTTVSLSITISGGGATPTGTATFQVNINGGGWSNIGSAINLNGAGFASTNYVPLSANNYQFQVVYSGDTNYIGATGSSVSLIVNKATISPTGPSVNPNPDVVNHAVAVSITIVGVSGGPTPTGQATFQVKIGAGSWTNIGSAINLVNGAASTTYTPNTVNSYQFQVLYNGDSNYNSATSSATTLPVLSGIFGNQNTGTGTNYQDVSNVIRGAPYAAPATGTLQSITAYIYVTSTSRNIQAALYTTSGNLLGTSNVVTGLSGGAQSATFSFTNKPALTAGTTYVLVLSASTGGSHVYLYFSGTGASGVGDSTGTITYGTWPSVTFTGDIYQYCIYGTYSIP